MTKITWKGEAEGPPFCIWNNITFPVGVAVEVSDEWMIAKARGNRFFEVEDYDPFLDRPTQWREPTTEADPADVSFYDDPPPSSDFADVLPDYPQVDRPDRFPLKRKRGRPRKVTTNGQ